ncbi:MAG TPA: adenylate kinase [Chloroflexia bacterium]|nr:adenylate kinase [Chloroflexia bacterium]
MIILLLGAPGAGKGTQSEVLSHRLGMVHVASGDLLRENRRNGTPLGKLADDYIRRGALVPDGVVIEMITHRLEAADCTRGVILDGFPRTVVQAESLDRTLAPQGKRVDKALYIKVAHDALIDRLSGRWICRNCQSSYHEKFNPPLVDRVCDACGGELYQRDDDRREVAEHRLEVYFEQTMPVIEYYRRNDSLEEIDGEQDIECVSAALMAGIGRIAGVNAPAPEVIGSGSAVESAA